MRVCGSSNKCLYTLNLQMTKWSLNEEDLSFIIRKLNEESDNKEQEINFNQSENLKTAKGRGEGL